MRLIATLLAAGAAWLFIVGPRTVTLAVPPVRQVAAGTTASVLLVLLGAPVVVCVLGGCAPAIVAFAWRRRRQRLLEAQTIDQWPDFLSQIRSRLAVGEPLPQAVRMAGRSLGGRFDEFDRAWAGRFAEGLNEIQRRWRDPVADRVLVTLRVASWSGGRHVDEVLADLATTLAQETHLRRAHEAAVSQQQMTAAVALLAPWLLLGVGMASNPQTADAFASPTGGRILWFGAAATLTGYLLARRAARLSKPPRVLR